jgi:hypothetical protein
MSTLYLVTIKMDKVTVQGDWKKFSGSEVYFIGKVVDHSTGRSKSFKAGGATVVDLSATPPFEFLVDDSASIPIELTAWDDGYVWDSQIGKLSATAKAPWSVGPQSTAGPGGLFTLNWSVSKVVAIPAAVGTAWLSKQFDGSQFFNALNAPLICWVQFTDIDGLYKPGVDDRAAKPPGTTRNSGREAGYTSQDNKGRIFTNRKPDGTWVKDTQYVDITAEVMPKGVVLPAGSKMVWTIEDPDDPTNEDPRVRPEVGRLIDPNDYTGAVKSGANPNDNDPRGKADQTPKLEQLDAKYALSGSETLIDIPNRISKVRFHVHDVAGANYIVRAKVKDDPKIALSVTGSTGIMTVWHRVDVEYVKMDSADELPVSDISKNYDISCVQVDVGLKRVVIGASDRAVFDSADQVVADAAVDKYAQKPSPGNPGGEFWKEGEKGWFWICAASRLISAKSATILFEGDAKAFGDKVRLPVGTSLADVPAIVRVFNPAKIVGKAPPLPNDHDLHSKFGVAARAGRDLTITPHDFHKVDNPDVSFLDADLSHYGFATGATIRIQVLSKGDEALVRGGTSPGGVDVGGKHFFGGKLIVFTKNLPVADRLITMCHELCHAFDNAHKCGNWDWIQQATLTSCCMNYWFAFVLDDSAVRKPMPWTQNRCSATMCGPHIVNIRDYHLEKNPGLGW